MGPFFVSPLSPTHHIIYSQRNQPCYLRRRCVVEGLTARMALLHPSRSSVYLAASLIRSPVSGDSGPIADIISPGFPLLSSTSAFWNAAVYYIPSLNSVFSSLYVHNIQI